MLSIHVPALLPLTSAEIDISHMVSTAAVVGVGLLYEETAHRRITEVTAKTVFPATRGLSGNLSPVLTTYLCKRQLILEVCFFSFGHAPDCLCIRSCLPKSAGAPGQTPPTRVLERPTRLEPGLRSAWSCSARGTMSLPWQTSKSRNVFGSTWKAVPKCISRTMPWSVRRPTGRGSQ